MKRKFWNWVRNEGERTLFLNGEISDETWYGDEVTPKLFKDELLSGEGDITVWINSPGGDVFAAAQIYNMLMDYKGNVTVKIDGLAASAASDEVLFDKGKEENPEEKEEEKEEELEAILFSRSAVTNSFFNKLIPGKPEKKVNISELEKRLSLLKP